MKARIVKMQEDRLDEQALKEAGELLKAGFLVAFPTETVYGLGGNALDPSASKKIYAAKGRPSDNPLIVHIASLESLSVIAKEIPASAMKIAEKYWPGPLTIILQKADCVPSETTGGLNSVAIRFPNNKIALGLIENAGGFVAAPSANTSGRPSPTTAAHVAEDLGNQIEYIIDGGPVGIGLESTIVDFTEEIPHVLRPGYISLEMLKEDLPEIKMDQALIKPDSNIRPKAPGMKYRHYAPKADLTIFEGEQSKVAEKINELTDADQKAGKSVGIIAAAESLGLYPNGLVKNIGSRMEEETIAHNLYEILREFDAQGVDVIYSEAFYTPRMGQAIMNRLSKAAGQKIIKII